MGPSSYVIPSKGAGRRVSVAPGSARGAAPANHGRLGQRTFDRRVAAGSADTFSAQECSGVHGLTRPLNGRIRSRKHRGRTGKLGRPAASDPGRRDGAGDCGYRRNGLATRLAQQTAPPHAKPNATAIDRSSTG